MAISSNKKKAIYVSVTVLGGLASIFGIAGAFNGVKQGNGSFKYALDFSYCTWPSSPAAALGIVGFFFMLAAQITSNACGGCVCCCVKQASTISSPAKTGSIVLLVFSWLLTIIASVLLFVGGVMNSGAIHMKLDVYEDGLLECYYPPTVHLLAGGVLSLVATGLSLIFFHIVSNGNSVPDDNNVANGQATGYPQASFNVQMTNKNNEEFHAPPAATAAAAFHAPQPGAYHAAIPVARASHPAGYY